MRSRRQPIAWLGAILLGTAGLLGLATETASAAQCSGGGVSVVVDFNRGAGGGIETACDAGGGAKYASTIFRESGFDLTYVSGSSFVCKVKSLPTSADCSQTAPSDAYWGLYWAKPGSTSWTYSSLGVSSLRIPEGAAVAFSWQNGGDADPPGTAPAAPAPAATTSTPTRQPTAKATTKVTAKAAPKPATAATRPAAPTPSPTASAATTGPASASPEATAASSSSASVPATPATTTSAAVAAPEKIVHSDSAQASERGLPWWLPAGLVVALGAASGVVWRVRRSRP